MRIAIVHYWLVSMRGGEKVLEALCDMYPEADIFTLVCDPQAISDKIKRHKITTSFLQNIPGMARHYQSYLPLMPFAIENLDLSGYDLIISSESGPAKGIIPPPHSTHICYCHSPMRYIWDHYHGYRANAGFATRFMMPMLAPMLRSWDVNTSLRVDKFIANSHHVAARIEKYYRRQASVIYPPVAVEDFSPAERVDDFYLCAGQIVPYKRVDLAVQAFTQTGRKLVVIGEGKPADMAYLKKIAGPNVTFLGRTPFSVLKEKLATCRALVFPGEEDFGMVPVEAMASGRPVIAYASGGALETVIPRQTGMLFEEQSVPCLIEALSEFEKVEATFDPIRIRQHAANFSLQNFRQSMQDVINAELLAKKNRRANEQAIPFPSQPERERRPVALY